MGLSEPESHESTQYGLILELEIYIFKYNYSFNREQTKNKIIQTKKKFIYVKEI